MDKKERMVRPCSEIVLVGQQMTGYYIREKDLQKGDITSLKLMGYSVYGVSQTENKPFSIENREMFRRRAGIVAFRSPIVFPKRVGMDRNCIENYLMLNNQWSYFNSRIVRRNLAASTIRPNKNF